MSDVYVTPYLNELQMTSGTLAYSFGLGKAVVSTPYWHAKELLADGRGVLVPFGDAATWASEIAALLSNDVRRHAMRKRAYAASRSMTWPQTAKRYLTLLAKCDGCSSGGRSGRPERDRNLACAPTAPLSHRSVTSCRCATAPACCSMPSIRCRTARTAIASMTMPGR